MLQLFSIFFLFLASSLASSEYLTHCQYSPAKGYEIQWEAPEHINGQLYRIFVSDDWESLHPISSAGEFLASNEAKETLLASTGELSIQLKRIKPYVRIIGEADGRFWDIAPLLHVRTSSHNLDLLNYAIKKKGEEEDQEKELTEVAPYLLPKKHFAHNILEEIFAVKGVLSSIKAMEDAGFTIHLYRQGRGLILASHPLLPNYFIKTYLDTVSYVEWTRWVRRAKGKDRMQSFLNDYPQYKPFLKVPNKWIFKIPKHGIGRAKGEFFPRRYILLVEDMHLVDKLVNEKMYQKDITYSALDGLYLIIDRTGFSDGHIGNIPFSTDGRLAFIDTEYTNSWPVHFHWLTKWFSPTKQSYWTYLIENLGPSLAPKK